MVVYMLEKKCHYKGKNSRRQIFVYCIFFYIYLHIIKYVILTLQGTVCFVTVSEVQVVQLTKLVKIFK